MIYPKVFVGPKIFDGPKVFGPWLSTGIPWAKWSKINEGIITIEKEFDAPKVLDYPFHIEWISHDDPKVYTVQWYHHLPWSCFSVSQLDYFESLQDDDFELSHYLRETKQLTCRKVRQQRVKNRRSGNRKSYQPCKKIWQKRHCKRIGWKGTRCCRGCWHRPTPTSLSRRWGSATPFSISSWWVVAHILEEQNMNFHPSILFQIDLFYWKEND